MRRLGMAEVQGHRGLSLFATSSPASRQRRNKSSARDLELVERKSRAAIEGKVDEQGANDEGDRQPRSEAGPLVDAGEQPRRSIDAVCENAALAELWA
jgi:hypothetical protein